MCTFLSGEKQILETRCIKQHAFFGRSTAWLYLFFRMLTLWCYVDPKKKGGSNQEREIEIKVPRRSRVEISITRISQKGPIPGAQEYFATSS